MPPSHLHGPRTLALIAAFKFVKAILLVVVSVGLFHFRHPEAIARLGAWLGTLQVTTGHEFVGRAIHGLLGMDEHTMSLFGAIALVYAALYSVEGVGLWRNAEWAKYLTLITTCLFIPIEIWEIARRFAPLKVVALVVNIAIVVYLVWLLRAELAAERGRRAGTEKKSRAS